MNKLRLFILLIVGLASTARADFVVNNTSLPTTKTNLRPLPLGADPTKYIQAVDYNSLMQAALDLRTALVNGEYHGLATQATDPLPVNATNYTWLDLAGALHFKRGGDGQIAYGPVTTKGDILAFNGSIFGRVAVGTNGQCLQAASGQPSGLVWGQCGGGLQSAYTFGGNKTSDTNFPPLVGTGGAVWLTAAGGGIYVVDTNANNDYSLAVVNSANFTTGNSPPTFWVAANNNNGFGFGGNAPFTVRADVTGSLGWSPTTSAIGISNQFDATVGSQQNDSDFFSLESSYWDTANALSHNNWVGFNNHQSKGGTNDHPVFAMWEAFTSHGVLPVTTTERLLEIWHDGTNVNYSSPKPIFFQNSITWPGTEGNTTIGAQLNGTNANANQYLLYTPAEVGAAKWGQAIYQATNAGSARKNQVHAWGWNLSASGGQLVGGEAAVGLSIESFYQPAGTAVNEFHIVKYTNAGALLRPFSMEFNRSTGVDTLSLSSDTLYFQSPGQVTSYWIWDNTTGTVQNFSATTPITYRTNNVPILAQRRVGGGNANLLKLTSSDVVAVDPDGLGASFGADLAVAGNITTPGNVGSSGTPVSIVYGDNFRATVGSGGFDTKTAGQLTVGSTNATSTVIGHQTGTTGTLSIDSSSAVINSPDGGHSFNALNSGIVIRGGGSNALLMSENGLQLYFTVDLATSFAKDGLIDLGVAGQRWRSLQIHGGSARPTCDSTAVGKLWRLPGGVGVTDALDMCLKSAADTYTWRSVATGG